MEEKLIYDRECIRCLRYPECKGKPIESKGNGCISYEERSKEDAKN
jgi:hypothetical protein